MDEYSTRISIIPEAGLLRAVDRLQQLLRLGSSRVAVAAAHLPKRMYERLPKRIYEPAFWVRTLEPPVRLSSAASASISALLLDLYM